MQASRLSDTPPMDVSPERDAGGRVSAVRRNRFGYAGEGDDCARTVAVCRTVLDIRIQHEGKLKCIFDKRAGSEIGDKVATRIMQENAKTADGSRALFQPLAGSMVLKVWKQAMSTAQVQSESGAPAARNTPVPLINQVYSAMLAAEAAYQDRVSAESEEAEQLLRQKEERWQTALHRASTCPAKMKKKRGRESGSQDASGAGAGATQSVAVASVSSSAAAAAVPAAPQVFVEDWQSAVDAVDSSSSSSVDSFDLVLQFLQSRHSEDGSRDRSSSSSPGRSNDSVGVGRATDSSAGSSSSGTSRSSSSSWLWRYVP